MSRKILCLLVVALSAACLSFSAMSLIGPKDNSTYGPLKCDMCRVAIPMPDDATEVYINRWIQIRRLVSRDPLVGIGAGGKIIVCNDVACTTYQRTNSGDWNGIKQEYIKRVVPPRVAPPPKANKRKPGFRGGVGDVWNGGGWNGAWWNDSIGPGGSLRPDVTVGPPKQERRDEEGPD